MTKIAFASTPVTSLPKFASFPKKVTIRPLFSDADIPLRQETFSKATIEVLNTFYRDKLPATSQITVRNLNGKTVKWDALSYSQKEEIITHHRKGKAKTLSIPYGGPSALEKYVPRWEHGLMHISRTALLVRIAANMYREYGGLEISEKEILLAQYLAAFHDSARQAEGVDVWDDESAENAYPFLLEKGFSEEVALECVQILKEKDSSSSNKHILTKLIQCADCLDIMRVYGLHQFNNDYLDIYKDFGHLPEFRTALEEFKKEYRSFIKKSDAPLLKVHLERKSSDYFGEVESLMLMKKYDDAQFPLISEWYQKEGEAELKDTTKMIFNAPSKPNFGKYTLLKEINEGTHPCYILSDEKGELFFFKELHRGHCEVEEIGALLTAEITDSRVPKAKTMVINSKTGVLQPYIELKKTLFKGPGGFKVEDLTHKQKEQLFTHMIADYVIRNYDAHTGQFGIDNSGNIIALDKGHAFRGLTIGGAEWFFSNEPCKFDPNFYWPPLGSDQPTYSLLSKYLVQNKREAKSLLESPSVKKAFQVSQKLVNSPKFSKMIGSISKKPTAPKESIERVQSIERDFRSYFEG